MRSPGLCIKPARGIAVAILFLVGNLPLGDAAAQAGITLQGASQAVLALRRALELARVASGGGVSQ